MNKVKSSGMPQPVFDDHKEDQTMRSGGTRKTERPNPQIRKPPVPTKPFTLGKEQFMRKPKVEQGDTRRQMRIPTKQVRQDTTGPKPFQPKQTQVNPKRDKPAPVRRQRQAGFTEASSGGHQNDTGRTKRQSCRYNFQGQPTRGNFTNRVLGYSRGYS